MLIKLEGKVLEALRGDQFLIELSEERKVRCYFSGKMRLNHIRVLAGDNVIIELDDSILLNNNVGRIIKRN